MPQEQRIDVSEIIDNSRVGRFQTGVVLLCGLCLIMDGFDLQAMGYVGPSIIQELHIASAALAPAFAMGLLGVLLGSLMFSVLADKIGRRNVLIGATLYFSALTLLTPMATTIDQLIVVRFLAGLGLGAIMPNAVALVAEYSPKRLRATLMMSVANGFTIGAAFGGFVSAWLIPMWGWRSVFYFGGAIPLVIAIAMIFRLPESLPFLIVRGKNRDDVARWLKEIDPSITPGPSSTFVVRDEKRSGVTVGRLFRDGRAAGTLLLWMINFMNLVNLYALSAWLPTVVKDSGHSNAIAVWAGTTLQVGGMLGTFGLGWIIDKFGFIGVLGTSLAIGCVSIALIGEPSLSLAVMFVVVFVAGWCVIGGQSAVNALSGTYYPTYLRSTGIGWALGIGRIGAIIGPLLAGEFMRRQWSAHDLFLAAAVPAAISTIAMFALKLVIEPSAIGTGRDVAVAGH